MQERRALGLCYNCDEKFFPGHKCTSSRFLLLLDDPELIAEPTEEISPTHDHTNTIHFHLSPQALSGTISPKTLKFTSLIPHLPVIVLIDSGSSHNILQPRIAHHLNLAISPSLPLSVMVGNGAFIKCQGICPLVDISLQNSTFTIPFYLLPIEGADVVLGVEWLSTLGSIQADFSIPSIQFTRNNQHITLQVAHSSNPLATTYHQFCHYLSNNSIASLHLLSVDTQHHSHTTLATTIDNPASPLSHLPSPIKSLLQEYQGIFQKPRGLPPQRPHDHHIPLLPHTPPIKVKSYRYPHHHKEVITTLISEMLQEGIIQPSTSPFSSPVLLIKKKDGTWRFCVDYGALNAATIREHFPIPTIDELLDELGSATVSTKIDLHLGYRQILVLPEDTHKTAFRTIDGHYEFLVMPFGLTNAPSTF